MSQGPKIPPAETESPDPDFEALLEYLHRSRSFDFTGYKRASLVRRVAKRMDEVGVPGFISYIDYLEVHPEEFRALFDTILINVTGFFRDPPTWEVISAEVIPRLVAAKGPDDPIRIWSAGCASGEEAYSLAIALAEALGPAAFRDRVKIYATDLDDGALAKARSAQYTDKDVLGIPPDILAKYFEPAAGGRHAFHKDYRRSVIFGRHDLIQDAPISRIDLLTCRNVLMYFNAETQARILDRFHYALTDRGFLALGKAETLMMYNNAYVPVDLKRRIFAKVPRGHQFRDRLPGHGPRAPEEMANHARLREFALESGAVAQLIVESGGLLAMANSRARALFAIDPDDLGRPFQDLKVSYRPVDLRSSIDRACSERRAARLAEVEWAAQAGEPCFLDIHVVPLLDPSGTVLGASVTFVDATANRHLQDELQNSNRELEVAYEELQSANEELETMNEELQSTIEELETTNEELQSTNEELETMNEELQSTNEEIETVNEELRIRGDERDKLNLVLQSILVGLRSGVIVVDTGLLIQLWNARSEDLWGLRPEEVLGKSLMGLDIGLPLAEVRPALQACLAGDPPPPPFDVDATTRRGRAARCSVTCIPMVDRLGAIGGVILVIEAPEANQAA